MPNSPINGPAAATLPIRILVSGFVGAQAREEDGDGGEEVDGEEEEGGGGGGMVHSTSARSRATTISLMMPGSMTNP
jgi:hypothetical protein